MIRVVSHLAYSGVLIKAGGMMANPYDLEFANGLEGQQETQRLELKSSRDLLESFQKRTKFISDQLVPNAMKITDQRDEES